MKVWNRSCVDLGSEHCPCWLAVTGDCLICSRLQERGASGGNSERMFLSGEDCDCEWSGSCPYTLLAQNGGRIAERRREISARLIGRKDYDEDISVLILEVGCGFAQKASIPGSFVFLRPRESDTEGKERLYEMPVSVMKVDETAGTIHLTIRKEGPKSKTLLNRILPMDDIVVRGPYFSGLLGAERLRPAKVKGKRVAFLTKGIGAAPAILAMDRLIAMDEKTGESDQNTGLKIRWLADDTNIDRQLLEDYSEGVKPEYGGLDDQSYDIVVISGSPYFVETMRREVRKRLPEAALVVSNDATMCCGEGICGACTEVTKEGRVIRRCKCSR